MTRTVWEEHVGALTGALDAFRRSDGRRADAWGRELGRRLARGHRVLAAGNGGSAAQAQHFTAELVGRYLVDRGPVSAIALHADTSTTTAIGNDYGPDTVFARQVTAHGRAGDVALLLSTSGRSGNVLAAARAARDAGLTVWALTGPAPNPLADLADDFLAVDSPETPVVQEVHLVAVHVVCAAAEQVLVREQRAEARR